jgi:hypothetical protein
MFHFCTYFDSNYLLRGLTLYRSLLATGCDFKLHVLALDERADSALRKLRLPNLAVLTLEQLEIWEPNLLEAKSNRRLIEYFFTLSPVLPLYLLSQQSDVDLITYLDADLYFYGSPQPIFDELGNQSILITEHRFPDYLQVKEKFGRYNVQYQSFRRDEQGLACLQRWMSQCLEWCYDRLEDGRFADQKYLEEWPRCYDRLVVLQNKGAGIAPWNWARYPLCLSEHGMTVDGAPLIFYHFHGVKIFNPCFISNGLLDFGLMPWRPRRWLYGGYVRQLRETRLWLIAQGLQGFNLKDRFARGKGISAAALSEISRKAWSQSMFIF